MTGGIAYVLDETGEFISTRCNRDSVDLEPLEAEDRAILQGLIRRHRALTASPRAAWILDRWEQLVPRFVKVFPREYKRVLGIPAEGTKAGIVMRQAAHG
jgi:glutamate synthase domain-containing protein 3